MPSEQVELTPETKLSDLTVKDLHAILLSVVQASRIAAAQEWQARERDKMNKLGIVRPITPQA